VRENDLIQVTLGLVVKNAERTLGETIKSIVSQDFPHELLEIIVVDGISQDKTMSIVNKCFRKVDISLKTFATNKGLGQSRQIVVDNAKGKYIIWVDGDIVLPKYYVRKQVTFMEGNPKAGVGVCYYAFKKGLSWIANIQNIPYVIDQQAAGPIYRKDALEGVGGYDIEIKGACEDVDVVARIVAAGWSKAKNHDVRIYHNARETLKDFLKRAEWYGVGRHFLRHKHEHMRPLWWTTPLASFAAGLKKSKQAYKLEYKKEFFLMPFVLFLGAIFWWLGFTRSHFQGYGHNQIRSDIKI